MTGLDIVQQRLLNQRLAGPAFEKPDEVVRWLGAVQAQEYPGAKWALSQRTTGVSNAAIDKAFADGAILDPQHLQQVVHGGGIVIVLDGHVHGTWKRVVKKDSVVLTLRPFAALTRAQDRAVAEAVQRYSLFLDMPVVLE